jgi:endonuclease/exonuclease/phosphatase family metal-dependent hydrolase
MNVFPYQMKTPTTLILFVLLSCTQVLSQSLRIATYNVNWGLRGDERMLQAITATEADVICLQETTPQVEQFLRRRLARQYPDFHSVGHNGNYAAERFVIASKTKLSDLIFYPPNGGLFGFYTARCRLGDKDIQIVSVHLTPAEFSSNGGLWTIMNELEKTEETHAGEIESILKRIDTNEPAVILGDFNSLSQFRAPRRLLQAGFVDAMASVMPDADMHPTWHWPANPRPLKLRIDYIFHTRDFRTVDAKVLQSGASDHWPVVAQLQYTGRPPTTQPISTQPTGAVAR